MGFIIIIIASALSTFYPSFCILHIPRSSRCGMSDRNGEIGAKQERTHELEAEVHLQLANLRTPQISKQQAFGL